MKEYPIAINGLKDLLRLERYVFANHLHGKLRQNNFNCNLRNAPYLALALPLGEAVLRLEDCPAGAEAGLSRLCQARG